MKNFDIFFLHSYASFWSSLMRTNTKKAGGKCGWEIKENENGELFTELSKGGDDGDSLGAIQCWTRENTEWEERREWDKEHHFWEGDFLWIENKLDGLWKW